MTDVDVRDGQDFSHWSALHGDAAPTGLIGLWLRFVYVLAKPLAQASVSPNAITVVGLALGLCALWPASLGSRWPLLAALCIAFSALLDGLDGAVAVLSSRVTSSGARLDHLCDRITEVSFVAALWLAGGSLPWCIAAGALALAHEGLRSSARRRGLTAIGVVTVSERPTRVIVAAMFLLACGVYPDAAQLWSTAGAIVMTGAGAIGLGQLVFVLRASRR